MQLPNYCNGTLLLMIEFTMMCERNEFHNIIRKLENVYLQAQSSLEKFQVSIKYRGRILIAVVSSSIFLPVWYSHIFNSPSTFKFNNNI